MERGGGVYDNQVIMRKNHSFVMILLQFVFSFGRSQRERERERN